MNIPPNIPNHFEPPEIQNQQEKSKSLWPEVLSSVVLRLVGVGLLVTIAWTIISGLSGFGSGFGSTAMNWLNSASINPANKREFSNFLRLLLTAGFIGLLIFLLKKRGE